LLVAMFPANVRAARERFELAGQAGNGVVVKGADAGGFYWDDLVG